MPSKRFVAIMLLAAAALAGGCARKQTVVTPEGSVTVTEKPGGDKTIQLESETGKARIQVEKKTITEAELGAPVYPGATVEISGSYQHSGEGQPEKAQQHILTTPDEFGKVLAFYKSKLKHVKGAIDQTMGDGRMAMFTAGSADGSNLHVQITTDNDKKVTRIQIIKVEKGQE